jgi:hypothetical protein
MYQTTSTTRLLLQTKSVPTKLLETVTTACATHHAVETSTIDDSGKRSGRDTATCDSFKVGAVGHVERGNLPSCARGFNNTVVEDRLLVGTR